MAAVVCGDVYLEVLRVFLIEHVTNILFSMRRHRFLEEGVFLKQKKTNSGAEPRVFQWAEGFAAGSIKKTLRTSRRKTANSKSRLTVLGSSTPVPDVGR